MFALAAVAVAATTTLTGPAASAAPAPAVSKAVVKPAAKPAGPNLVGTTVDRSLFGMHVFNVQDGVWPTVPFGSLRLWDNETTWSSIEKSKGVFDWTKLDAAVANAQTHGMQNILLVLAGTPSWATSDPSAGGVAGVLPGAAGMPKDLNDWDNWVRAVSTRYKGKINAYQVWNEANLTTFSTGTPAQMAKLTKHAYDIIKSVDPSATVVAPSTGTRLGGPFMKFYPAYLAQLKSLGWPVDVFAAHTYPASKGTPVDRAALAKKWIAVLDAAGAPNKPLWDTENNYGLAGPGPQNPDQDINGVKAANWAARTYLDSLRLGISRTYWYAWGPNLDLVGIQMNAGSPAATAVSTLQDWIVGATYNGCTNGNKVTCTFTKDGKKQQIVWSEVGAMSVKAKAGTRVCKLNGSCKVVSKATKLTVAGPTLLTT
jgi:hypothetical protein